jgi:hypothetical protein
MIYEGSQITLSEARKERGKITLEIARYLMIGPAVDRRSYIVYRTVCYINIRVDEYALDSLHADQNWREVAPPTRSTISKAMNCLHRQCVPPACKPISYILLKLFQVPICAVISPTALYDDRPERSVDRSCGLIS